MLVNTGHVQVREGADDKVGSGRQNYSAVCVGLDSTPHNLLIRRNPHVTSSSRSWWRFPRAGRAF